MIIAATRMHRALTNFGTSDMCGFRPFLLPFFSPCLFDVNPSSYESAPNSGRRHSVPPNHKVAAPTPATTNLPLAVAVNTTSEGYLVSQDHHGPSMSVSERLYIIGKANPINYL
jgi:hypothetical protein